MFRTAIIVLVCSLILAPFCIDAAAYSLTVRAWIDGESQLIIQGNTVQWHNLSYTAPGYRTPGDPPEPTYLTTAGMGTIAWAPTIWSNGTSGDTTSEQFTDLNAPLAAVDQTVTLEAIDVRDGATIVQQPTAVNDYTLIVDFNDSVSGGAYWYELSLEYIAPPELSVAEGAIGTELTITGSGFGTKKGKVLIGGFAAKIAKDDWMEDQITCTINKLPLPVDVAHPVTVVVNKVPIASNDTFTAKNAVLDELLDSSGISADEITVTGMFFGSKKGKVYLYDTVSGKKKNCKVTYWDMIPATGVSELRFLVPKVSTSFTAGAYQLKVDNKIGTATASTEFTILP
jgi:IPT/TIG domain